MKGSNPIVPATELSLRMSATKLLERAEGRMLDATLKARRLHDEARREGHAKGLADGCAAAANLLKDARAETQRRGEALEDTLSQLVADTVRGILGNGDRTQTIRAAVRTALVRLGSDESQRLHISPDMAEAVRGALADADAALQFIVDDSLPEGTALLSGPDGHAHIGLDAQVSASLAAFEDLP
jgi:flagellar biosynthesis/type III secretory pathway protein FliH